MCEVGRVLETSRRRVEGAHFEWRIEGSREQRGDWIFSPDFCFAGTDWKMDLYFQTERTEVCLCRLQASQEPVRCWLGVRRADGGEEEIGSRTINPGDSEDPMWKLADWEIRKTQLAPSGTLTLLARMSTTQETDSLTVAEQEHVSNPAVRGEENNTPADNEDVLILQEHFKKLLLSSDDHDVLLKVQTQEFRAHKSVLRARSPVFEAMFKHGMKEDVENTVDIEDCDPNCFGQFLQYVYTGQVEDLSSSSAPSLYFCGDKYGFPGLKRRCVGILQSSLSAPLVSDVITLAVTHGEEGLLETTMDYVTQNLAEVLETVEWQRFAISNPIRANEVCLKAVKRRESSDFRK